MASPAKFNAKSPTIKRILREASELSLSPSPDYHASPASDSDLFEWHFTLRGPPSSAFAAGIYHGRIVLPPAYPLRPPSFRFLTPSGRFETNREICLSISGHHEETWQPAWGIRTALVALRSFMETDAKGQLGGIDTSEAERRRCANESVSWRCPGCGRSNADILAECTEAAKKKEEEGGAAPEDSIPPDLRIGVEGDARRDSPHGSPDHTESSGVTSEIPLLDTQAEMYPPARPAQSVPQPTAAPLSDHGSISWEQPARNRESIPLVAVNTPQRVAPLRQELVSNSGVPIWVDRVIAGLILSLAVMLMKKALGV